MRKWLAPKRLLLAGAVAAATFGPNLLCPNEAMARVKLITLPVRERVEIQLDNAAATLVEEERIVPLVKGENQVDFSWANTQIDPNTIVFRVVAPAGDKQNEGGQDQQGEQCLHFCPFFAGLEILW